MFNGGLVVGWTANDVPDQAGKTCLITGANSGLGFASAQVLAARGARVIMACRNAARGQRAVDALVEQQRSAQVELLILDLASLASIHEAAERFLAGHDHLDILINNAGLMAIPSMRTADGFEMQLGTNHLGHFALTGLLLPALVAARASRVVTVTSGMHRYGRIDFDDPFFEKRRYSRWAAYNASKLANLLFTFELVRRLERARTEAIVVAAHPGYAATALQGKGPALSESRLARLEGLLLRLLNATVAQSAAAGAWPSLRAATDPAARAGDVFGPSGAGEARGPAVRVDVSRRARDFEAGRQLWALSERLTGVTYQVAGPA
jgi:NAD(P)-dependent dehydrogenase (short-subunit alcohol dehydrogenase family)